MKGISFRIRLSKKVAIALAGVLVVAGAAGGYGVYSGLIPHGEDAAEHEVAMSGVACSAIDMIKLNRNGQRWLRKYVTTGAADGIERVRTALRITGVLAKAEKADLYQVVVLDPAGPQTRAARRGPAIGAEVLFAPDPSRLPGMAAPFVVRYTDAKADAAGLFFGKDVTLTADEVRDAMTAITDRTDCENPAATAEAEGAAGGHGKAVPEHGAAAGGHGEPAAEGHGEAPEGEAAAEGHEAPADAAPGHGAPAPEEKGGMLSSLMRMIPGMGGDEAPEAGGHGEAAAEGQHAPAEAAKGGMLSSLMRMIPGMGGDGGAETEAAAGDHAPPAENHEAASEPGHALAAPAEGGHGSMQEAQAAADAGEAPAHEPAVKAPEGHEAEAERGHGHAVEPVHGEAAAPGHEAPAAQEAAVPPSSEAHEPVTVKAEGGHAAEPAHGDEAAAEKAAAHASSETHDVAPAIAKDEETGATH